MSQIFAWKLNGYCIPLDGLLLCGTMLFRLSMVLDQNGLDPDLVIHATNTNPRELLSGHNLAGSLISITFGDNTLIILLEDRYLVPP